MKKFAIAAIALLFLAPAAWAGSYVGASFGTTDTTVVGGPSGSDTSWKLLGGYTFMKHMGVEGSYRNFGAVQGTVGTELWDTDGSSLDVFGVGMMEVGKFDLFAKIGFSRIEMDQTITPTVGAPTISSTSDNEIAYGAGASFAVGKAHLRVEYEVFGGDNDINMFSAGAVFKF